jgi:hypothetical protein
VTVTNSAASRLPDVAAAASHAASAAPVPTIVAARFNGINVAQIVARLFGEYVIIRRAPLID